MLRTLYFDCFSGVSGDMFIGAFLDAGMPLAGLQAALGSLPVAGYDVTAAQVLRAGISATRFIVREHGELGGPSGHPSHGEGHGHSHAHRSLSEICALIDQSALSESGRSKAKALFHRLAEAEAAVHRVPVEQVHLHEVGALDSIVDIVGAVYAMEWVGVEQVVCSPLNVGGGTIRTAHGLLPVPAPATVKLLGNVPVYSSDVQKELVTPTGALLVTEYAGSFGALPPMRIEQAGYGAGMHDNPGSPNALRILIGETWPGNSADDRVVVLECEIDDMNPQLFGAAMEQLYAAGAFDVSYTPVQMKKNRPGTRLTVIGPPALRHALTDVVFRETTTIGVRCMDVGRACLTRHVVTVDTPLGPVRFKLATRAGDVLNAAPEYDDCVALAKTHNLAVKDVQRVAIQAYGVRDTSAPLS